MKIVKLLNNHAQRLLLFFAGWSASPELFKHLDAEEGTDVWICYDYRDLTFKENLAGYKEVYVVAWSLGIWVATNIWKKLIGSMPTDENSKSPYPVLSIAINGTPYPIHDTFGIPESIFRGTLDNITDEGMRRFNLRMCGTRQRLAEYEETPARPLDEVREELQSLSHMIQETGINKENPATGFWTKAIISDKDRIFPSENLRNYWKGRCPITEIAAPHYPFYLWKNWNELWKL